MDASNHIIHNNESLIDTSEQVGHATPRDVPLAGMIEIMRWYYMTQ